MHASRHRSRGLGARARSRGAASTSSSPRRTCTSNASSGCRARPASMPPSPPSIARDATPTTSSSRRRTRRAATWTSCAVSSKRSSRPDARRSTCRTRSATRRRKRSATFFRTDPVARIERPPRDVQHALPRRPRACGGEHPGCGLRRRDAGRVHDQRRRRARRQCVARRDRDGHARPRRSAAVRDARSRRERFIPPASC